jgi:hypothetical protein
MRIARLPTLVALAALASGRGGLAEIRDGYHDAAALRARLESIVAAHPRLATLTSIGKSFEGRDLWVIELGAPSPGKPAIYIDAAHDGREATASEVALRAVTILLDTLEPDSLIDLLDRASLYVLPRANPDAVERFFRSDARRQPLIPRPDDDDRDERIDEDGPQDVDADGEIVSIRVLDSAGEWAEDPSDSRLLVPRKPEDAGPFFRMYTEGIDDDHDGLLNEDPEGGVALVHNFPQGWEMPSVQPGAGRFAASEEETRAILEYFIRHPEIGAALSLSQGERPERAGVGKDNRMPADDGRAFGVLEAAIDGAIGRKLRVDYEPKGNAAFGGAGQLRDPAEPRKPAPIAARAIVPGWFVDWCYYQSGAYALAPQIWVEPPRTDGADSASAKPARDPIGKRWLDWFDASGIDGFVAWKPYEHPTLGSVEIGGFRRSPREVAPEARLDSLATDVAKVIAAVARRMPRLVMAELDAVPEAGGVYRVRARLANTGSLPTLSAQADKTRRYAGILAEISLPPGAELIDTPVRVKAGTLAAGERRDVEWLLRAAPGGTVTVRAWSARAGADEKSTPLPPPR